jgi:hypothetical protein
MVFNICSSNHSEMQEYRQAILDIELFELIRFPPLPEASIPLDDRLRKLLELGASPSGFCLDHHN